ncbi:unnamed protein product [Amoebophrya sp. A25]|nr:unnamed protein product [Amoebophrya sp. A25]|eukprot:GSA25T00026090001.1
MNRLALPSSLRSSATTRGQLIPARSLRISPSSTRAFATLPVASNTAVEDYKKKVDEYLSKKKLVVSYFTATWCGPCQRIAEDVEALSEKLESKVAIAKIDIDQNGALAEEHRIMAVPTFVLSAAGAGEVDRVQGASVANLEAKLKEQLD